MEYNYNRILEDIRQLVNKSVFIWLGIMAGMSFLISILCVVDVLPTEVLWSLFGIIPSVIIMLLVVAYYHKKAGALSKKQQIAMMAFHAKKAIDNLQQEFPDTFLSDCQIRMRYLAKNGIDVDNALKRLGGNVDAYNQLVLSFLGESDKLEDALFDLMQPDTLFQYGSKAHALRVKANELVITNLTDTAFFHEIEAYAGSLEIVRSNWKKLSFELDEAYGVFFEYINSLGLSRPMTFQRWGEQLQEAFNALETYDTMKAKRILSDLMKYQIDADITKTLQSIITNIDEIMAN
ncbi:MAG: hypothetical protein K2P35_13475 [Lachnospiraceae bacterium]|nr:hypothetical protein [Lachnospiraceae bacterium]